MTDPSRPALSLAQQLAYVRRHGESSTLVRIGVVCVVLAAAALAVFWSLENQTLKVLALFAAGVCAIVALAVFAHAPMLRRAARASRSGRRVPARLTVTIDRTDSESPVFRCEARAGGTTWSLALAKPYGWEPAAGAWPGELVFIADVREPVLIVLEHGLLFPTRVLQRQHDRGERD